MLWKPTKHLDATIREALMVEKLLTCRDYRWVSMAFLPRAAPVSTPSSDATEVLPGRAVSTGIWGSGQHFCPAALSMEAPPGSRWVEKTDSSSSLRMGSGWGLCACAIQTREASPIHPHIPSMHRGDMAESKYPGRLKNGHNLNAYPYPQPDRPAEDGKSYWANIFEHSFCPIISWPLGYADMEGTP